MIVIRKQTLYNLIFAIALIFSFGLNFNPLLMTNETAAPLTFGKVVVIDPGHGSPDGGATGHSGTLEKDINLAIAKKLGSYLQQGGAHVIYTREDDNAVTDNLNVKIKEIKRADLSNRKNLKNNSGADLFISIHMNKFEQSKYKGAQVFYPGNSSESKKLAETIQQSITEFADNTNYREAKDSKNDIFILNDSKIPSVLVECGFLSNPEEEAKLMSQEYQSEIAYAIFGGISRYLIRMK
ncbi:MAG: N-acetylmuramoyl-L-alanine amidase CwlD [Clostridia bacterium]|nr:N-acetylmuramoyl-L-alanine amidase CwlD [Clostridia bacterium]